MRFCVCGCAIALCRIFRCIRHPEHASASKVDLKCLKTLVLELLDLISLLCFTLLSLLYSINFYFIFCSARTRKIRAPTMHNYPSYFLIIAAVLMPHPTIALCPVKILCPQRSLRAAWLTKPCSKLGIFNNAEDFAQDKLAACSNVSACLTCSKLTCICMSYLHVSLLHVS